MWISETRLQKLQTCYRATKKQKVPGISIDESSASVSGTRQPNQEQVKYKGGTVIPGAALVDVPSESDDDSHVEGENEKHILQWRKKKPEKEAFYGDELVGNINILQYMKDQIVEDDETLTVQFMGKEYKRKGSMPPKQVPAVSWGAKFKKIKDADFQHIAEEKGIDDVVLMAALQLKNIRKRKRSK